MCEFVNCTVYFDATERKVHGKYNITVQNRTIKCMFYNNNQQSKSNMDEWNEQDEEENKC